MMIKFRAKSLATGEWVIGSYVNTTTNPYIIVEPGSHPLFVHRIDTETLGQFTGFIDAENKDIYQHNIYSFPAEVFPNGSCGKYCFNGRGMIVWDEYHAKFMIRFKFQYRWFEQELSAYKCKEFKLLGNKFDNPEFFETA